MTKRMYELYLNDKFGDRYGSKLRRNEPDIFNAGYELWQKKPQYVPKKLKMKKCIYCGELAALKLHDGIEMCSKCVKAYELQLQKECE